MKAWGRTVCMGVAAAALLGSAGPASAFVVPASGPTAAISVSGTHGYRISFQGSPGSAQIAVAKGGKGLLGGETEYVRFGGTTTASRVDADFGHRGRMSLRFRPNGKVRTRRRHGCTGGAQVTRFGAFEGHFRFSGENDYTSFEAKRVAGSMTSRPRLICHRHPGALTAPPRHHRHLKRHRETITTFQARSSDGLGFVALRSDRDPESSIFFATASEAKEGNLILRNALTIGHLGSFGFDEGLASATLEPPAPFSGSAAFARIDDYASRWEGPLTVSFPGLPDAPLTGRDFSWSLTSSSASQGSTGTIVGVALARTRELAHSLAQGSGSHSQAFWDARLSWSR
jgi:hypothetical protein